MKLDWIYTIFGFLGLVFLLYECKKILSWKVVFYKKYLLVPSGSFEKYFFGRSLKQKVVYSSIKEIEYVIFPARIIFIKCKGKDMPNAIYVKQFSRNQILKILEELDTRVEVSTEKN
jgi:hypothetical protein